MNTTHLDPNFIASLSGTFFVSGIHTDAGKSYCTGWLARKILETGRTVITQKFIQTGNTDFSEDIALHRHIMGVSILPEDFEKITAPIIYTHPCSPQLAARIDNREIDLSLVDTCSKQLAARHDVLLVEGAGGLMVPVTDDFLTIDYVVSRQLPLIFVVNAMLGSINHTLLSFEAIRNRNIDMPIVLYNKHFDSDPLISDDTHSFIQRYLQRYFPATHFVDVPDLAK